MVAVARWARSTIRTRTGRVALYGHSQGAWVAIEAAATLQVDAVVANSGGAVSPAVQERYATWRGAASQAPELGDAVQSAFELMVGALRSGRPRADFEDELRSSYAPRVADVLRDVTLVPADDFRWDTTARMIDHDPAPSLQRVEAPILVVYGSDDPCVPVAQCLAVLAGLQPPVAIETMVVPGADHGTRVAGPSGRVLAPGYLDGLVGWLARVGMCDD